MSTGDTKDYQHVPYVVTDRTSILFQVKACGNVHVLLMANDSNQANSVYEIVVGKPTFQSLNDYIKKKYKILAKLNGHIYI